MPALESGKEIILFPPELDKAEYNEVLVLVGRQASKSEAPTVVALGVHVPPDVVDTITSHGGSVIHRRGPRSAPDGTLWLPPELSPVVETIPGKPTNMECRPVLNLFPDAPPHQEWDEPSTINRQTRIQNYPEDGLICARLERAAMRYLSVDAPCFEGLKVVSINWRSLPSGDISVEDRTTDRAAGRRAVGPAAEGEAYRCWRRFQKLLKTAEARGVAVNVEVTRVTRF